MANTFLSSPGAEALRCSISETLRCYHQNPECFQLNSEQCRHLCHALAELSASLFDFTDKYPNAQKEIYRAVKEAEMYLHHCSRGDWPINFLTRSTTGEGFSLHIHDLALYSLLLDLIRRTDICESRKEICHFYQKIDRFMKIRHNYYDEVQLFKICKQIAERSTHTNKNIVKISKFLVGKLKEIVPISISTEVESADPHTPIPRWLEIDPADLVLKSEGGPIGEGSFGHVYEGSWLGLRVAAKEMPKDAFDVFQLEASILAMLQSPFIVHLIGTCIKDSHLYLVMELVSSNLERVLEDRSQRDRPPLSLPVAVDIMLQISRAMEYLHSQGIMHLDLKSSNVLFEPSSVPDSREEGYGRVKLCDFGTASPRLFSFRSPDPKGTCYWRAPEVFPPPCQDMIAETDTSENYTNQDVSTETNSPEKYTNKADVYSFAMTCYEILTGKQPFAGVLPRKLYAKIVRGERPTLEPSVCPVILANYIHQCWETNPDLRPCVEAVSKFLRKLKLCILKSTIDWKEAMNSRTYRGRFYPDLGYFEGEKRSIFPHTLDKWKPANLVKNKMLSRMNEMIFILGDLTLEMRRGIAIDIASFLASNHGNSAEGRLHPGNSAKGHLHPVNSAKGCLHLGNFPEFCKREFSKRVIFNSLFNPIVSGVASAIPLHDCDQRERQAKREGLGRILVQLSTGCTFVDFWRDYIQKWIDCSILEFIDPQLMKETEKMGQRQLWEVVRWCQLGLWCLSESPSQQPHIHTVLQLLKEGAPFDLPRSLTLQDYLSSIPIGPVRRGPCGDWPSGDMEGAIDADDHLTALWMRTVLS